MRYKCLVLDHDDTAVQTETAVGYPFFCEILRKYRPGKTISLPDYIKDCSDYGFTEMCRMRFGFTRYESHTEHQAWTDYVRTHIPDPYPGMREIVRAQKQSGGILCVVSHSEKENISRDYDAHFGVQPDDIYGWELPPHLRKPNPYPLQDIMKKYALSPGEILVVDDVKLSWMMADPLGVPTAFAAWSKSAVPDYTEQMRKLFDFTFYSTEELYKFLFA